jgi:hypothetical protein
MSRSAAVTFALLALLVASPAIADTQVGLQGLVLAGTHGAPSGSYSGVGEGALLELDQTWPSVQLHLEGIPNIATATVKTQGGSVTATIGLFTASARFRLDRNSRYWAGIGDEVLNQQTPFVGLGIVDASRLAGTRFELDGRFPISQSRFIETDFGAIPRLSGNATQLTVFANGLSSVLSGAETASMIDLGAAYGIRAGRIEYLYGLRAINFAAKFEDGREADRNVGVGLTAEIRYSL